MSYSISIKRDPHETIQWINGDEVPGAPVVQQDQSRCSRAVEYEFSKSKTSPQFQMSLQKIGELEKAINPWLHENNDAYLVARKPIYTAVLTDSMARAINEEQSSQWKQIVKDVSLIQINGAPPPPFITPLLVENAPVPSFIGPPIDLVIKVIPEDSILRKILACVPVIGIIPAILSERSLKAKILVESDVLHRIKLIQVQNHYKIASIIRTSLSIAILVAAVGLGILMPAIGIIGGLVGCGFVAFHAYLLYKNKQEIKALKAHS